jgi:hypothetical protein
MSRSSGGEGVSENFTSNIRSVLKGLARWRHFCSESSGYLFLPVSDIFTIENQKLSSGQASPLEMKSLIIKYNRIHIITADGWFVAYCVLVLFFNNVMEEVK